MSNIIIVFASMTGNTEEIADAIAEGIRAEGIEPVVKSVLDTNVSELSDYEGILLGAYTWGDGDLPDEFLDFYDEMDDLDLHGRKAAVFGSADSSYSEYGAAVDILIRKLQELGAENVLEGMKIELNPSNEEKASCKEFGKQFVSILNAAKSIC
ncbi:flavodoxin [Paenibacillus eucommiae]|uniref:Flavodoxin n=1 Tax=Paenibacillus eucommiae TaxID=1355755 RepID=A0ABS4IXY2_9BACL|nr:flavodoxin [Paenibacillus eucommiae]MBP1992452.1 flavodoxin I [Paenibacillus eucommiae]